MERKINKVKKTGSHNKGPVENNDSPEGNDVEENAKKFQSELEWCIYKLEDQLSMKNLPEKHANHMIKTLKILISPNGSVVKKRQTMWSTFGDYRKLMKDETDKFRKEVENMAVAEVKAPEQKGTFFRFSHKQHSTSGSISSAVDHQEHSDHSENFKFVKSDNSFRFNFKVIADMNDSLGGDSILKSSNR